VNLFGKGPRPFDPKSSPPKNAKNPSEKKLMDLYFFEKNYGDLIDLKIWQKGVLFYTELIASQQYQRKDEFTASTRT